MPLPLLVALLAAGGCHLAFPFDPSPVVDGAAPTDAAPTDAAPADTAVLDARQDDAADDGPPHLDGGKPADGPSWIDVTLSDAKPPKDAVVATDKQLNLDKGQPPDKGAVPPDTGPACPKVLSEATGSQTGWYNSGISSAQIAATSIFMPATLYSGLFRTDPAELLCVPPGQDAVVELQATCNDMTIAVGLYEAACTPGCSGALGSCSAPCIGTSSTAMTCTIPAAKVGGKTIRGLLMSRGTNATTPATVTSIKIYAK